LGVILLFFVHRERHVQLFGQDSVADVNDRVVALLRGGAQMAAIKFYRKGTGGNLRDAATAVVGLANQNGIPWNPPTKISGVKFARNLAITAAALAVAWYLLPSAWRVSALIKFFGGWFSVAWVMTAPYFKGYNLSFLAIIAVLFPIATIIWEAGAVWTFPSIIIGIIAGAAFINTVHKTARAEA
jgi:hypothetical protein